MKYDDEVHHTAGNFIFIMNIDHIRAACEESKR